VDTDSKIPNLVGTAVRKFTKSTGLEVDHFD
jgi:hypothetical protein